MIYLRAHSVVSLGKPQTKIGNGWRPYCLSTFAGTAGLQLLLAQTALAAARLRQPDLL